jgi:hypothetical protein
MALQTFDEWKAQRDAAKQVIATSDGFRYRANIDNERARVDAANAVLKNTPFPDPTGFTPVEYITRVNTELGIPPPVPGGEANLNRETLFKYTQAFESVGIPGNQFGDWLNYTFEGGQDSGFIGDLTKAILFAVTGGQALGVLGGGPLIGGAAGAGAGTAAGTLGEFALAPAGAGIGGVGTGAGVGRSTAGSTIASTATVLGAQAGGFVCVPVLVLVLVRRLLVLVLVLVRQ